MSDVQVSYLRIVAVLLPALFYFFAWLAHTVYDETPKGRFQDEKMFIEQRSIITYTVEHAETLNSILHKQGLNLSIGAVVRLNPHLSLSITNGYETLLKPGMRVRLFIQTQLMFKDPSLAKTGALDDSYTHREAAR